MIKKRKLSKQIPPNLENYIIDYIIDPKIGEETHHLLDHEISHLYHPLRLSHLQSRVRDILNRAEGQEHGLNVLEAHPYLWYDQLDLNPLKEEYLSKGRLDFLRITKQLEKPFIVQRDQEQYSDAYMYALGTTILGMPDEIVNFANAISYSKRIIKSKDSAESFFNGLLLGNVMDHPPQDKKISLPGERRNLNSEHVLLFSLGFIAGHYHQHNIVLSTTEVPLTAENYAKMVEQFKG